MTSILVIDTDTDTCILLREILETEGFATTWCNGYAKAEDAVVHTRPDIILLGVSRLDCAEQRLLEMLRQRAPGKPIVLMSTSPDLPEWAAQVDAAGFLGKPFDVTAPVVVVRAVLEARRGNA